MWSTHRMEYYTVLKRKQILTPATTWMNLKDIAARGTSQSQKDKSRAIFLEGELGESGVGSAFSSLPPPQG